MNETIFKAYDVRGRYPREINEEIVEDIAKTLGSYFGKGALVVGEDARLSSPSLSRAVLRGLRRAGRKNVRSAGLITTPMLTFLAHTLKAAGGIMVTASHNPKEYNGVKAIGRGGAPISGEEILKMVSKNRSRTRHV